MEAGVHKEAKDAANWPGCFRLQKYLKNDNPYMILAQPMIQRCKSTYRI